MDGEPLEELDGKVAIITGSGTGIGRGIALALAQQNVRVVICGRRREPLEDTAEAIWALGGGAVYVQADVSKEADVERLVKAALENYETVDILVNNAGIGGGQSIHEHSVESWDEILAVNLRGPFLTSRAVLPIMRENCSGHILNISSESGMEHYPGDGAYGISKHALNDLGEYIQRENQDRNIRVDTICPGMVVTPMSEDSAGLDLDKCLYPEDIADLAVWLLSRRPNLKIGRPVLIQTMLNPWE